MAVAGYAPEQISVKKDQNTLIITGDNSSYDTHIDYVRKGISSRKFNKEFTLGQYIDIAKVDMQNGLLIIELMKNIPEEKKPKTYDIGFENKSLICG
jgi:molecular chaperone IbpA